MDERHDIFIRERPGDNPPDALDQLRREVQQLGLAAPTAARKWLAGKGEAELAKAAEIKTRVLERIKRLEMDLQQAAEKAHLERERSRMHHAEQMEQLRTERLKAKTEALSAIANVFKQLREIDVAVDISVISSPLRALATEIDKPVEDGLKPPSELV